MFRSPLSDHFYSGDDSYIANATSSLGQFSTPLKKLASSDVNEARHNIHSEHQNQTTAALQQLEARSERYKLSDNRLLLTPLSDVALLLNQERTSKEAQTKDVLFSNSKSQPPAKEAIFYKPYSNRARLLKDFLPPRLPQKGKNPIIIPPSQQPTAVDFEDLSDAEDVISVPTGEWTSPVVKEALRRQVNKEKQFKIMWSNIISFAIFHLTLLMITYVVKLYQVTYYDENKVYRPPGWLEVHFGNTIEKVTRFMANSYHHVYHLQWVFAVNILVCAVRLFWPQDQCKDLPLTSKQRKLIGLKELGETEEDGDFVLKQRLFAASQPLNVPRYPKINELSGYIKLLKPDQDEAEIALQNIIPKRRLAH